VKECSWFSPAGTTLGKVFEQLFEQGQLNPMPPTWASYFRTYV